MKLRKAVLCGLRKLIRLVVYFLVITVVGTTYLVWSSGDPNYRRPTRDITVNDVTQINPVRVSEVVRPQSIEDIVAAIRSSRGPISIGGGRYSMGGQTSFRDSLHLDMRSFSKILKLDREHKEITVQSGITWRDIQEAIDPHDLSVRIMQTYSNFTVGGSLSVNVHGRYIGEGPIIRSVKSIRVVIADGSLVTASPTENAELFYGAIGGYGGLGVIVEATLGLTENRVIAQEDTPMRIGEYPEHFRQKIRDNDQVIFHNADIYPPDLTEVRAVSWLLSDQPLTTTERLIPRDESYWLQPRITEYVANRAGGKWLRQHVIDPLYYARERVAWRNWEASYDVRELEPASREESTYVLREYFVPVESFEQFVPKMQAIFQTNEVNVLNVSIRHALPDPGSLLAWAKTETFAFVVYYEQGTDAASREHVRKWSSEMIDAVLSVGGSYYLPYQIYETPEQFAKAYPRSGEFFALKRKLDPDNRFRNALWNKLYPFAENNVDRAAVTGYYRPEDQTFLSIPEWYLVFNPVEYAAHLNTDKSPSEFPYFESIQMYWSQYDRVLALTNGLYPDNEEYRTMLDVIGISMTAEFMWKGLYEASIGRLSEWTADAKTPEEAVIAKAHTAYSQLIFDKAWYEFEFLPWVKRVWQEPPVFGDNLLRKWERKLSFTIEFGFKAMYAELIGMASRTAYEPSAGVVYVSARLPATGQPLSLPTAVKQIQASGDVVLLELPRWGEFTKSVQLLANQDVEFLDIAGNQKIVVSVILQRHFYQPMRQGALLFEDPLVSDVTKLRSYFLVPAAELKNFLDQVAAVGATLEHVYDY